MTVKEMTKEYYMEEINKLLMECNYHHVHHFVLTLLQKMKAAGWP